MLDWIRKNSLIAYFIIAYLISWSIEIPLALSAQKLIGPPFPSGVHYFASFGPMLSAVLVTAMTQGGIGVKDLLSRLLRWRVKVIYILFSVLGPIVMFAIATIITRILEGAWPDLRLLGEVDYLPYIGIPAALALWLVTYGIGEEIGWRGFALPRLQQNRTAACSATVLGLIWGGWHIPALFYRDTYLAMGFFSLPMLLISVWFASILMTWLYYATGGSLLMVVLFHGFFNLLSVSEAGGDYVALIMGAASVVWAVFIMRRYGPENAAPVHRQVFDPSTVRPDVEQSRKKGSRRWYNPIMAWVLRSPLHPVLDKGLTLITVQGRKSRRAFSTPVNFVRDGRTLWITSRRERMWWRNLRSCAPVNMLLQGVEVEGIGEAIEDRSTVADILWQVLGKMPTHARFYHVGLDSNGLPRKEDCIRAADALVMIRIDLP